MRFIAGLLWGIFLSLAMIVATPAAVRAQEADSAWQARMAYICALADMAVYDSSMNEAVRQEMRQFGWYFQDYRQADRRADTTFYTIVHEDGSGRQVLVVIPGTEKLKDVEVDLRFGKVLFGGTTPQEFRSFAATEKVISSQPMVHQGFNDYTMTAFFTPDADGIMGADRLRELADDGYERLYLTGHSLGGAVATLLAARLVSMGVAPDRLSVFTFGAPTVGNTAFAEEYGYRIDLSRYTMGGDVVGNALQALKSGYVHFGTEYRWKKNENSHKFNHAIAGYLDAAIRGYYDELLQGDLSMANLAATLASAEDRAGQVEKPVRSWGRPSSEGRVYIAPVALNLPENIANDSAYMQVVAGYILMHQFSQVVADDAYARPGAAVDALFGACRRAEEAGCDRVAMVDISGVADKENPNLYRLATALEVYTTTGEPLLNTTTSTTTKEITPIEAVMYDMTRVVDDIKMAQEQGILPK